MFHKLRKVERMKSYHPKIPHHTVNPAKGWIAEFDPPEAYRFDLPEAYRRPACNF